MYVEIAVSPGVEDLQLCCVPNELSLQDPYAPGAAVIVVVYTTAAEGTTALTLAQLLAGSDTRVWLVCLVTRTLLGWLRMDRFMRFAKKCIATWPADRLDRLRILACPCPVGRDPVENFVSARSVVVIRTRWWRPWGRGVRDAVVMPADRLTIIL
jgi:hypothetical protein